MTTDLLQIFLFFIFPVILLYLRIVPVKYRFTVLTLVSTAVLWVVIQEQWTLESLGIRTDNLSQTVTPYIIFAILGAIVVIALAKYLHRKPLDNWWTKSHFLFLFIPISVLQEFAFRGFLMPKLAEVFTSPSLVILINSLLFSFLHIIYPNQKLLLPVAFLGGLGFAGMYYFYPNLILISLAHMVVNFVAVLYQFFTFPQIERRFEKGNNVV